MIDADSYCLSECSPGGNCDDDGSDAKNKTREFSSEDCADADCNCRARYGLYRVRGDGQCIYGGQCNR